jgi:hypothetical protein
MTHKLSRHASVLLGSVMVACSIAPAGAQQATNPDAKVLADYQSRIDEYMKLHKRFERESPPLKENKNPATIEASQKAMAGKLQAARKGAKQGEIFTPDVQRLFRRLMYPEMERPEAADTKASMKEDAPKGVPLKVNAEYPEAAPLPTVPPNLLAALPKLPEDLEYRFINKHLILRDVHANLIVDYMSNALQ